MPVIAQNVCLFNAKILIEIHNSWIKYMNEFGEEIKISLKNLETLSTRNLVKAIRE